MAKQAHLFDTVLVPVDPGGGALAYRRRAPRLGQWIHAGVAVSAPVVLRAGTKEVLDNCKLQHSWETEEGAAQVTVQDLRDGRLD